MAKDSSASVRQQSPHVNHSTLPTDISQTSETNEHDFGKAKIEALAEIICAGGDEPAAALLVLMRAFETSTDPRVLAHTVKHLAFTRCGELNIYEMVDAQIAVVESELLGGKI